MPEKCGEFAISFAEFTIQKYGTTEALPNEVEIKDLLHNIK